MNLCFATERLIDALWVVVYSITPDGEAHIYSVERDTSYGTSVERNGQRFRLIEDADRTVEAIEISTVNGSCRWVVANPRHVFSYDAGALVGHIMSKAG